ncbi:HlyD family type I secretion periplasmic adaptor subunit [Paraburkholderia sp. LEh10]|jgi:protease secretion system membrane fusion protein|uniref:HlyD family type I secretion periplasmic adaptor subunit n=1 Tax=Paraburkholderia sp. LEh10 TaxID=2821353 RepID=UPI001AE9DD5D|nr:HlyD family type I secretion periplasmic adaptor subunit [Paraburkholderia sp. LEh10]MBP0595366.1 HlyD family type I secretion periplasmic adaptor subunit [Paraburkholderia sp. LEh10]
MFNPASKKAGTPALEVLGTSLPPEIQTDELRYVKVGWTIVLVGVVGSLLWATFAPLSKGVPVQGTVVVTGNRKQIQHPTGGIVEDILVHDGDVVKAGQVLVRMNSVQARAQQATISTQYLSELAVRSRLEAEATGAAKIVFPAELLKAAAHNPQVEDDMRLQQELLNSRRAALQSSIGALRQTMSGYGAQLAGSKDASQQKQAEQKVLSDQLANVRQLANEGYVPRTKLQDLEREDARIQSQIATQYGNSAQLASQIAEARLRIAQQQEDYMKEVRTQLTDVERDTSALRSKLSAIDFEVDNTELRAPVDGTVVGVNVFTNGGVIAAGAKLMEVVPSGEPLEVEAELPVNLVDKVHDAMPVDMMFTAFNQNTTPRIPGAVSFVSADRLTNERTGTPFYRLRIKVSQQGMKELARYDVKPGMPVEVFVKAGERSMLSYLLKPVVDRAHTALTED